MSTKKVYVLSETLEREIHTPVVFNTFKDAVEELINRWGDTLNCTREEALEAIEEADDMIEVWEDLEYASAYGETLNHDNIDWKIHCIEIEI